MINVIQVKINHMTINETTVEYKGKNPKKEDRKEKQNKERKGGRKQGRKRLMVHIVQKSGCRHHSQYRGRIPISVLCYVIT